MAKKIYRQSLRYRLEHYENYRIIDKGGSTFLLINGGKVFGPRQILEKVRSGILNSRKSEPQRIGNLIFNYLLSNYGTTEE